MQDNNLPLLIKEDVIIYKIDLSGQRYGEITVIGYSHTNRTTYWNAICDCGNKIIVRGSHLKEGHTRSCGCHKEKHGMRNTDTYNIWKQIVQRCTNENNQKYYRYGGRGIKICERWLNFKNFYEDMGDRPERFSIDRIDVNGNYCKENCRWADNEVQQNNRRDNINLQYKGETKTLAQWCRDLNVKRSTLRKRLVNNNWSMDRALKPFT